MNRYEISNYLYSYLLLEHKAVGMKLYSSQEEFDALEVEKNCDKSFYCTEINRAFSGRHVKSDLSNQSCETGSKLLGMEPFYEEEEGIEGWYKPGYYATRELAKLEHDTIRPVDGENVGVLTGPVEKLVVDPDVVMVRVDSYQAMRLIQAYSYYFGFKPDFKMSGMCGTCFEATALPIRNKEFTISMLCSADRHESNWTNTDMLISFPYEMANKITEGLIITAQIFEPNEKKLLIKKSLNEQGLKEVETLEDDKAYFYN